LLGRAGTGSTAKAAASPPQVVRELLTSLPGVVPNNTLSLIRVTIPGHVALAPHRHPGFQTAYIQSGQIEYRVYRGIARIYETGGAKLVRTISPGQTGQIRTGQYVVETPNLWHSATNTTGKPVIVLTAALLASGQPRAVPVTP
jgi:quercetin dioxygenase-like cupin family protein